MNGIDKFVREAMPIQEEEKASVKRAAKARPILKPSSTSDVNFTLIEQRQWIDIEIQESKGVLLFSSVKIHHSITSTQSKKFIEKKMEECIMTKLSMNARQSNPTIQDIGQTR